MPLFEMKASRWQLYGSAVNLAEFWVYSSYKIVNRKISKTS